VYGRGRSLVPLGKTRDFGMTPQNLFGCEKRLRYQARMEIVWVSTL
jgi:hypothetical protein